MLRAFELLGKKPELHAYTCAIGSADVTATGLSSNCDQERRYAHHRLKTSDDPQLSSQASRLIQVFILTRLIVEPHDGVVEVS